MIMAIEKMITMGLGKYRMLGGSSSKETHYALVNIAAFLAQSMHETIKYDACDENNWDSTHGYTAANACGQLGQSYQDYSCSAEEAHMQCEVDPNMEVMAMSHAKWYGAPGPMFCAPKAKVPKAPRWNIGGWCSPTDQANWKPWASPDEFYASLASDGKCNEYENQKAGHWEQCSGGCANAAAPNFGQPARTDVEGCCWWGRGVIQTTGVCNFGKLNYYAGARAAREGRSAMFPNVDFCRTPDAICTSKEHPDLKWVAGLFYWTKEVQGYPVNNQYGFDYISELEQFTDAGNIADTHFIDKCSGIVNRGCPSRTGCAAGAVHEPEKRAANFRMVLEAMGFPWTKRRAAASAPSQVKPLEPATLPFPAVRSANGPE
jgi:predicted chitinase